MRSWLVIPVLILEKAQLGDLKSFTFSEQGRMTTVHDRLGLCTDIASAIIALHLNGMPKSLRPAKGGQTSLIESRYESWRHETRKCAHLQGRGWQTVCEVGRFRLRMMG